MALTTAQETTLAAHIRANQSPAVIAALAIRNDVELARLYNLASAFIVWRKTVQTSEVGNAVNYIAVEAMTDANRGRITTFYTMNPQSFVPRSDIRSYWGNTFSGALGGQGQATRDALEALWRRAASIAESIFATGTGTTVSPGETVFDGILSYGDISSALNANP